MEMCEEVDACESDTLELSEVDEVLRRFRDDPRVDAALRLAASGFEVSADGAADSFVDQDSAGCIRDFIDNLDAELHASENECANDYIASCEDLMTLRREILKGDGLLEAMESMLVNFQSSLSGISSKIRKLQNESLEMNTKLRNRRSASELLTTFIDQILVTPQLVKQICAEPVNDNYLTHLSALAKKLEHATQPGVKQHPSCASSIPELERLKIRAVVRIRDFLAEKISDLKRPKTNVQILQRNVLVRYKDLYRFLAEHHPQSAFEVRQLYIQVLSHIYASQFRTYSQTLQKLQVESSATRYDLLGQVDHGGATNLAINASARALVGNLLGISTQSEQAILSNKSSVFSLSGREQLLGFLDSPPLVRPVAAAKSTRCHYEELFRSHQKLLIDTVSSEYFFLVDFFSFTYTGSSSGGGSTNSSQPSASGGAIGSAVATGQHQSVAGRPDALFVDVFHKTLSFFLENIQPTVENSHDSVGLLLLALINGHNRLTMQRRRVSCLDAYLDKLQGMIWRRLKEVLNANTQSLVRASPAQLMDVPASQLVHPHYVTRRYAELACALHTLSSHSSVPNSATSHVSGGNGRDDEAVHSYLSEMQSAVENLIQKMALELPSKNERERVVFRINNWDLILTVFHERGVATDATFRFGKLLRDHTGVYVESQLQDHFGDLIDFVREAELALGTTTASNAAAAAATSDSDNEEDDAGSFRTKVNIQRMEHLVRKFSLKWKASIGSLRSGVMSSFTNFTNGLEILKQILTQLLLYYTRFQKVVLRAYPPERQQPFWVKDLVPNNVILAEIRQHSQNLD